MIYEQGNYQLLTPLGTIIYLINRGGTTIDLTFGTPALVDTLIEYNIIIELDYRSDYLPTLLRFQLEAARPESRRYRCWKKLDLKKVKVYITSLDINRLINTTNKFEDYLYYLSSYIL